MTEINSYYFLFFFFHWRKKTNVHELEKGCVRSGATRASASHCFPFLTFIWVKTASSRAHPRALHHASISCSSLSFIVSFTRAAKQRVFFFIIYRSPLPRPPALSARGCDTVRPHATRLTHMHAYTPIRPPNERCRFIINLIFPFYCTEEKRGGRNEGGVLKDWGCTWMPPLIDAAGCFYSCSRSNSMSPVLCLPRRACALGVGCGWERCHLACQ